MKPQQLPMRTVDGWGAGHFGAPRGNRTHKGVDAVLDANNPVFAPVSGVVTKIGYPYGDKDKMHFRYVQINKGDYDFRVFYVAPHVRVGYQVKEGDLIGYSQDLEPFYPGITPHIHLEIKKGSEYIDPTALFVYAG